MAYDFSTRLDTLGTRMAELHDNSLVYIREEVDITITNFTPEKIDVDQLQALGIIIVTEKWQDFVFDYSELEDLPTQDPKLNDKLVWDGREYRVSAINDELYIFTTSSRKRIRVHAKQTG